MELLMNKTNSVRPLRQRMIEDMAARKLNPHTRRSHVYSCKRFAAWLKRSPDTATPDEVRRFQLYLIESGASICNRNRIMTGVRFLSASRCVGTILAAEVWHLKEPQKLPPVLSRKPYVSCTMPARMRKSAHAVELTSASSQTRTETPRACTYPTTKCRETQRFVPDCTALGRTIQEIIGDFGIEWNCRKKKQRPPTYAVAQTGLRDWR
jgi:Phage integrase, N-terminal SAM-like domain